MALECLGAAWFLLFALSPLVSGDEDCLWYQDMNGAWNPGFDCYSFTFCCGNCHQRFCCLDPLKRISEREQKTCLALSPKTIAAIGFAVLLFLVVIITLICCFMCSCCYLYQRRHQRGTPYRAQEIQMSGIPQQSSYPVQPPYPPYPMQHSYPTQSPYPIDPKVAPPPSGSEHVAVFPSGPSAQYPVYSPGLPMYNPNDMSSMTV